MKNHEKSEEHIVVKSGRNEFTKILTNDILYFKADGNYTHIKLTTGISYILRCISYIFSHISHIKLKRLTEQRMTCLYLEMINIRPDIEKRATGTHCIKNRMPVVKSAVKPA